MTATQPRLPWQFYLAGALGLALVVGLLFVAFTVALFLLPVVLVVVLWQRWRWQQRIRAAMGQAARREGRDGKTIDGDFVVVDEGPAERR
jgi:membrane protein implicated in regulation of membrane protease activity